jgi:hypothetical protein
VEVTGRQWHMENGRLLSQTCAVGGGKFVMKTHANFNHMISMASIILSIALYSLGYSRLGIQVNLLCMIPIIMIALIYGMKIGALFGISISLFMSTFSLSNDDSGFRIINAFISVLVGGFGGGMFGLLSDQRRTLKESEKQLSEKVTEQTVELHHLYNELRQAYQTTLEGWARALELRDKETEGHSRRVTEISVAISRKLGLAEGEIRYIYYGALLHDIGKMGIPDEILNKPGPLTLEEREVVNQHPLYAYELLKEIEYLQPAISIPYSHHENWDGTGYPQGLQGEDIPLSARIFSVVDNWDALTSDRPYRRAWSRQKTIKYIQAQSGKMFDPQIVALFTEFIISFEPLF